MNSDAIYIAYVILALITALILTLRNKTDSKFITFMLAFWILGASVIRKDIFVINIESLGGDLQIRRIIFLILTGYLIIVSIVKFRELKNRIKLPYEKYLYLFVFWFLVVIAYHSFVGTIKLKELVVLIQGILSILVIYLVLKRNGDDGMLKVLAKSLIIVSIVSSITAIIQFFIAKDFMRIGTLYPAFGGYYRSNGIFWSEYMHSYTLVAAVALTLVTVQSKKLKYFLNSLFLFGILLSFHRMSWIVTFVVFSLYLIIERRQNVWKFVVIGGVLIFAFVVVSTAIVPLMDELTMSDVYQSRLSSDTISTRFRFYNMVLERIDKVFFWGAGSRSSSLYYYGMLSTGVVNKEWALGEAGGIHNLYLEILFFYGFPQLLLFCLLLYSLLKGYLKLYRKYQERFLFFFLFMVMYCLMNLTNAFPLQGDFGFILSIVIGCGAASAVKYNEIENSKSKPVSWL